MHFIYKFSQCVCFSTYHKKKAYRPYCCHIRSPLWGLTLSKNLSRYPPCHSIFHRILMSSLNKLWHQAVDFPPQQHGILPRVTWWNRSQMRENTSHSIFHRILVLSPNKLWHKAVDFPTQQHGILSQHSTSAYILNTSQRHYLK